jgi:uncharacterized repeat protein (TIGR01451 family)
VGAVPQSIVGGDLNRDGKADLVVANSGSGNVSVLLGNGDGTFQSAVNYGAGIASPEWIFVGDFNGDGKLDVAAFQAGNTSANAAGQVSVLLGNGDGTLQAAKVTTLSVYATQMRVADFNGDHWADLAVSEFNNAFSLSLLLGKGDGTFQAAAAVVNDLPCAGGVGVTDCTVFATADFDRDGKMDLGVAGSGSLQILLGRGDGTFRSGPTISLSDGYVVGQMAISDLNSDGIADLIVTSTQSSCAAFNCRGTAHYSVLLGNGDGSFQAEQIFATGSWSRNEFGFGESDLIGDIFAADFDGDGKLDLVDRRQFGKTPFPGGPVNITLELRLGNDDGTFGPAIGLADPGNTGVVADLNGDKLADLVVLGPSNEVQVIINMSPTSGADMALIQAAASSEPVGVGQNLTYNAILLDEGPENATGITFTDTLPGGTTFVSAASTLGSCATTNLVVTCNVEGLSKGASAQISIVVTPTVVGTIINAMNVTARETDADPTNNSKTQVSTVKAVHKLAVTKVGSGTGIVTSGPGLGRGVNCGSVCTETFFEGVVVQLAASPDPRSSFDGWGGACSGDACLLTMNGDKAVTATFDATPDFAISPASANLTTAWGGQASEPVGFAAAGGFAGNITVTCSVNGSTPLPTCNISPGSVTAGGSAILTVNVAKLAAAVHANESTEFEMAYAICLPFGMVGCLLGTTFDRKRARKWMACLLVLIAGFLPVACGGAGPSKTIPQQSYVVTITAVSGTITHAATVNLTVGQ